MKKTLVALAALAATSAFAQSTVTLSGRASLDVSTWGTSGSTAGATADHKSRVRVADTASRITFAANEDLGGGNKAGVYCETGINMDSANIAGQANTDNGNTNTFCSREGRAYFGNNTAEVRLGRQNVWWTQGELNQVGSTFLGSDSATNIINGGVGVYTVRGENMIKLTANGGLGAFAGSEIYTGYMGASGASTTQINGAAGEAVGANTDASGKYSGLKAQYATGPWVLMLDQQSSKNAKISATSNTFNRDATKVGLGFKYNPTSIVTFQTWNKERKDQTTPTAAFGSTAGAAKDSGYAVVVKHDLGGGWMAHAQYAKAGNIKGTSAGEQANTGAKGFTLGATKAFSKRTHVYGAYHKVTNESAATYGMGGGNYQSGSAAAGADTKMIALGMIHNF
jgi:predicted porin